MEISNILSICALIISIIAAGIFKFFIGRSFKTIDEKLDKLSTLARRVNTAEKCILVIKEQVKIIDENKQKFEELEKLLYTRYISKEEFTRELSHLTNQTNSILKNIDKIFEKIDKE